MVKYIFEVEKMMCHNCEKHVVDSVKKVFPTAKVVASHTDKKVEVTLKAEVDEKIIISTIEDRGRLVKGFNKQQSKRKSIFSLLKK